MKILELLAKCIKYYSHSTERTNYSTKTINIAVYSPIWSTNKWFPFAHCCCNFSRDSKVS